LALVAKRGSSASAARAAESWGLPGEQEARFEARVVDLLCELTGDCPADCGAGTRQLGLLRDDGTLVLPLKNQVIFAGAAAELLGFCDRRVVTDGLMVTNRGHTIFALQFVKAAPDGKWQRANRFLPIWAVENGVGPKSATAKRWFENDPRVRDLIARDGKLGLGLEADQKYLDSQ
jgi:hypothetical protein